MWTQLLAVATDEDDDGELKAAIGARVRAAQEASEYPDGAKFYRALVADGIVPGLADQNAYYMIARGEKLPKVPALSRIAEVAGVSLDWLVRGEAAAPPQFREWLEKEGGERQLAGDEPARRFLAAQPIPPGQSADPAFYDLALVAYRRGLRGTAAVTAIADTRKRRARKH